MNRITFGKGVPILPGPGDPLSFQARKYGRPINTKPPTISGSGTVGAAQSRIPGTWAGTPTVTWAWFLDLQEVAQGGTYTPVAADSGKVLTVLERAVDPTTKLASAVRSVGVTIP